MEEIATDPDLDVEYRERWSDFVPGIVSVLYPGPGGQRYLHLFDRAASTNKCVAVADPDSYRLIRTCAYMPQPVVSGPGIINYNETGAVLLTVGTSAIGVEFELADGTTYVVIPRANATYLRWADTELVRWTIYHSDETTFSHDR